MSIISIAGVLSLGVPGGVPTGPPFPTLTNLIALYHSEVGITKNGSNEITAVTDQSGTGNDLVNSGTVKWVASQLNGYPIMRRNTTYVGTLVKSSGATLPGTDNWTMGAVFNVPVGVAVDRTILGIGNGSNGYGLASDTNDGVHTGVYVQGDRWFNTTTAAINGWQYVLVERASGTLTIYVNGVALPSTFSYTAAAPTTKITLWVAGDGSNGAFADIAHGFICNAALSSGERSDWFTFVTTKYGL